MGLWLEATAADPIGDLGQQADAVRDTLCDALRDAVADTETETDKDSDEEGQELGVEKWGLRCGAPFRTDFCS
jgi:hypothetical protein